MIKRRGLLLVVFSLLLGAGAAWIANNWVQQRMTAVADVEPNTVNVVAAAMKIPYGTLVEPRHLRVLRLPADSAPEGAFATPEAAEGKVATADILAGEILLEGRFADHLGGSTLAALIDPEHRAVTLRVNDVVGVAGFLLPGNRVDVLATRMSGRDRRAETETILRDIKVLAVDQYADADSNEPVVVRAVTLEVTPPQSEALVRAREEGSIQLALRNPSAIDPAPVPEEPKKVAVRSAPRGPVTRNVTVIRGTQVESVKTRG